MCVVVGLWHCTFALLISHTHFSLFSFSCRKQQTVAAQGQCQSQLFAWAFSAGFLVKKHCFLILFCFFILLILLLLSFGGVGVAGVCCSGCCVAHVCVCVCMVCVCVFGCEFVALHLCSAHDPTRIFLPTLSHSTYGSCNSAVPVLLLSQQLPFHCSTTKMQVSGKDRNQGPLSPNMRRQTSPVCNTATLVSNQTRRPAELKHISKRRKRNQPGFP